MMMSSAIRAAVLVAVALATARCNSVPLFAPTGSTITLSAGTRVLPTGGSTELTAFVMESAGTPVQDGTSVLFSTTLGTVSPTEALTRNGFATATFNAGSASGIAEVRAISGGAGGGTSGGTTGGTTGGGANSLQITVGAAAVNTVTVRANPGNVGPNGGTVEIVATVVAENGRALEGILVTFNADQGRLSSSSAVTNSAGEARTTLTTSSKTIVSATAGTKPAVTVTVDVRSGPGVTITCATTTSGGNCAAVEANSANQATVTFTVSRASSSSALSNATIDFGDGTSQSLGNLGGGSATVTHTYTGPSDSNTPVTYTASVRAFDINGESTSTSTSVGVTPRPAFSVTFTATATTQTQKCQRWEFQATVTPSTTPIQSFEWNFGDGTDAVTTSGNRTSHVYTKDGRMTVLLTARTADGRTATAREEIVVQFGGTATTCG